MKLSDAIEAGNDFAQLELHNGRFFKFTRDYSFASSKIGADPLFAAYLGKYKGSGLLDVVRALKSHDRPTESACWLILDGLSRAFRDLGATCSDAIKTVAGEQSAPAVPGKKESLWMYVCRMNDVHKWPRHMTIDLLRSAGS